MPTKQRSTEQSEESKNEGDVTAEADSERDQSSASEAELQNFLEQQITQAIEPVLADFRAQMTQAVQQEMEHAFSANADNPSDGGERSGGNVIESEVVDRSLPSGQENEDSAQQQDEDSAQQHNEDSARRQEASSQGGEEREQDSPPQSDTGEAESLPGKLTRRLQPVPATLVQGLEHKVGDWLQSLVMAGLTAALSEASRAAIQGRAEQGLDALLQRAFDALPDSANKRELQAQTERTLHAIVQDVFDAVYAEDVRKELQAHGEKTARSLIQRDFDGALDGVRTALQRVGEEILSVLRRQWQKVLRLMLKLIMAALDSALPGDDEKSLPDSSEKRGEKEAAGKK